jgi:hypothetical protein
MSTVYYLKKLYTSMHDGYTKEPLCISTNEKQLSYIANRLNKINTGYEYSIETALEYKPKNISFLYFVINHDSCFNYEYSDIVVMVQEHKIENYTLPISKDDDSFSLLKLKFKSSLSHSDIHSIMLKEYEDYKKYEEKLNNKFKADYWQLNPNFHETYF